MGFVGGIELVTHLKEVTLPIRSLIVPEPFIAVREGGRAVHDP